MARTSLKTGPLRQISVATTPEAEDAVSALLERLFRKSASVFYDCETHRSWISIYIEDHKPHALSLHRTILDELRFIADCGLQIHPITVRIRRVRRVDWEESWKRHFTPIQVGNALLIKPSWSRRRPRANQQVIVLDPGLSFGTGQHPTTKFCLRQIGIRHRQHGTGGFLDIGTGSGILAIAAAKLGFNPVRAIDSDPDAVRIAQANAHRNGVDARLHIELADLTRARGSGQKRYDLICANLVDKLLIDHSARIISLLSPDGQIVLAGILTEQFSSVRKAYETAGLKLAEARTRGEWRSGVFKLKKPG